MTYSSKDKLPPESVLTVSEHPEQPLPLAVEDISLLALDQGALSEYSSWLSFHRIWGGLSEETRRAIAQSLHCFRVESGTPIYQQGQTSIGLYLLKSGTVEISRRSPIGKSLIRYHYTGELFGYVPLVADLDDATYQATAIPLTTSEILFLLQAEFRRLIAEYSDIQQVINSLLAQDQREFALRISWLEERTQRLQPHIQFVPQEESILGNSRATKKLIAQITLAASNGKPVIFQAQPGTGKTFLARQIHARSELAAYPLCRTRLCQIAALRRWQTR